MSFKDRKRDDHGHVIGNEEQDGQKCQHVQGGSNKVQNNKIKSQEETELELYNRLMANVIEDDFDGDYEEEFNDDDKIKNEMLEKIKNFETLGDADNLRYEIDKLEKNGDISEEVAEELRDKLDSQVDAEYGDFDDFEDFKDEDNEYNREMEKAQNENADMRENEDLSTPADFGKKTAKMPNGKEMSLFDFAHNIVNYLDTDTASTIIAAKYGVSENDAKAFLESPYNREGSKEDYERKLNNSRG